MPQADKHVATASTRSSDTARRPQSSRPSRFACHHCRARRVRCDRADRICGACSRLGFACSYPAAGPSISGSADSVEQNTQSTQVPSLELTQAGTKRKRSWRACLKCREDKAKCSGHYPCRRCRERGMQCSDSGQHQLRNYESLARLPTQDRFATDTFAGQQVVGINSNNDDLGFSSDRPALRELLEHYFDKIDPSNCNFLHRPSIFHQFSSGVLDTVLLKAICAMGARLKSISVASSTSSQARIEWKQRSEAWMREVQTSIVLNMGCRRRFIRLQCLVLVIRFLTQTGALAEAAELLALAARLAFTLRLNHEYPELSHVEQESRRRLMWALYLIDSGFCGGSVELSTCPAGMMHIRLPCDEQSFQRGVASRNPFLVEQDSHRESLLHEKVDMWPPLTYAASPPSAHQKDERGQLDILAHAIQLRLIRHRILRYTKNVRMRTGLSPFGTRDHLEDLQAELTDFEKSLPGHLKLASHLHPSAALELQQRHEPQQSHDKQQLLFMAHSADASGYILLHVSWLQCHCDLYRFLIPGLREAVTQAAIDSTPATYVESCQRACLDSATSLCRFWSALDAIEGRRPVVDAIFSVSVYQVTRIIQRLQHWIPPHQREVLRCGLSAGLKIARADLYAHVFARRFVQDAEKAMGQIWNPNGPSRHADGPFLSGANAAVAADGYGNGDESDDDGEDEPLVRQHLFSRHSVVSRSATSDGPLNPPLAGTGTGTASINQVGIQAAPRVHERGRRSDINNLLREQDLVETGADLSYTLPAPPQMQATAVPQTSYLIPTGPTDDLSAAYPLDYEDLAFLWDGTDEQMGSMYDSTMNLTNSNSNLPGLS